MAASRLADSVEQLGLLATELEACESIDDVYTHAVTAAERVLEFDTAVICTVEDGAFEPQAANVSRLIPADPLTAESGIAGKTIREDRTYVVDDLTADPDAAPTHDAFRSVLSIPLEDGGLVQFHSTETAAFSAVDRHLGELLVATVTNARNRVTYETALETERDQFAALFENVPDAALQYRIEDGTQLVDAVNSAFIRVFGYDAEDAVGESLAELLVPSVSGGEAGESGERGESGGKGEREESEVAGVTESEEPVEPTEPTDELGVELEPEPDSEPEARPKSEFEPEPDPEPAHLVETQLSERADVEVVRETAVGPRPFLLRNIPVATNDGTSRGYLIYTDLTELKLRERELERKNERLDQFASIVSHDLRNPLNVADGYLELALDRDGREDDHSTDELEEVQRAHDRMKRLIEDVLTMARGESVDNPEPVDVDTVAETAWNNVETETASLEATSDGDTRIPADRGRLLQLFENLFRNAIDHAGPDVCVRIDALSNGFAVEDDGPGIPVDERDAVFEFGRTGTAANTGLGLAIVRQIAEEHGWTVEIADGSDGDGARFEFTNRALDRADDLELERDREFRTRRLEGEEEGG